VENLTGLVGGERYKGFCGVPTGVNTCCEDAVVLDSNLMSFAAFGYDCASMVGTDMEKHAMGVVVLIVMAVHTMVFFAFVGAIVLIDRDLTEVGEVTLVESKLPVKLVTRFDKAVGEVAVYFFFGDMNLECGVVNPFVTSMGIEVHCQQFSSVVGEQLSPGCAVDIHLTILVCSADETTKICHKGIGTGIYHHEIQRGDVWRNRDVAIVGIDDGCICNLRERGRDGRRLVA